MKALKMKMKMKVVTEVVTIMLGHRMKGEKHCSRSA